MYYKLEENGLGEEKSEIKKRNEWQIKWINLNEHIKNILWVLKNRIKIYNSIYKSGGIKRSKVL